VFDFHFYTALSSSKDETLSAIAQKSIKEIAYHQRHSASWMLRFGNGTDDSKKRLQDAVDELWRFTGELFEMNEVDEVLLKEGIAVDLSKIKELWEKDVFKILNEATISTPLIPYMQTGSRTGKHSEHLGFILAEMQYMQRMIPNARW
jgi:ring-1,2-phenylacetyl-CoA epoxidase subunit PaaC